MSDGSLPSAAEIQAVADYLDEKIRKPLGDQITVAAPSTSIYNVVAKELGFDAGFGMNSYADDVASYIAQEMDRRMHQ